MENRDAHDISEADQAAKHAAQCPHCRDLLGRDEALEAHIGAMLGREETPARLKNKVDLNLDHMRSARGSKSLWALVAACCIVLVATFSLQLWMPVKRGQPVLSIEQLGNYILTDYQDHGAGGMGFEPVADAALWLKANLDTGTLPPEQLVAGYTVKAARFCYLGSCLAGHLIYEKNGRTISIFVIEEKNVDLGSDHPAFYTMVAGQENILLKSDSKYLYAAIGM